MDEDIKTQVQDRTITDFLNNEYFNYSIYVVENRACPSLVDGLKTGARKIMHASFKGSLKNGETKKVTNLAGETMNYSLFQHGDSSLNGTIITISQDFNFNLNPLFIDGQNGSLRSPDAASPRYLYVRHSKYTDIWKVDYDLLEYEEEEGQKVEPKYYLPIIPTVLTATQIGLAPGYRFSCISYNPIDIIDNCMSYIKDKTLQKTIRPYVRGIKTYNWKYETDNNGNSYWVNYGEWMYNKSKDIMWITDLPYDVTFDAFESMLNKYIEQNFIKDWKNFSNGNQINYCIQFDSGRLKRELGNENTDARLPNKFKLIKKVPDDQLWVIDENGKVKHFSTANDLIMYFVDFRLKKYNDRKSLLVSILEKIGTTIFLDEDTSISEFVSLNTVNGIEAGTATFTGAFLYPDLLSRSTVLTDGKDAGFIKIETGKSLSIPVTFEYALDGERLTKITKALYFDIRDSLDIEPQHFMLEITANYDFSASGNAINNFGI